MIMISSEPIKMCCFFNFPNRKYILVLSRYQQFACTCIRTTCIYVLVKTNECMFSGRKNSESKNRFSRILTHKEWSVERFKYFNKTIKMKTKNSVSSHIKPTEVEVVGGGCMLTRWTTPIRKCFVYKQGTGKTRT